MCKCVTRATETSTTFMMQLLETVKAQREKKQNPFTRRLPLERHILAQIRFYPFSYLNRFEVALHLLSIIDCFYLTESTVSMPHTVSADAENRTSVRRERCFCGGHTGCGTEQRGQEPPPGRKGALKGEEEFGSWRRSGRLSGQRESEDDIAVAASSCSLPAPSTGQDPPHRLSSCLVWAPSPGSCLCNGRLMASLRTRATASTPERFS